MFKNLKLLSLLSLTLPLTAQAAEHSLGTPQNMDKMPVYDIQAETSFPLPDIQLQLTGKGLRILPMYLNLKDPINPIEVTLPVDAPRMTLKQTDNTAYCLDSVCWPKSIEVSAGILIVESHTGETSYFKDTKKLEPFLWNEAKAPLKELKK